MKKLQYIFIFAVVAVFSSCGKYHSVEGNHDVESEVRNETGFTEIHSSGEFDVYISQDSVFDIVVEAEENLLPYIETEVHSNVLEIDVKHGRNLENHFPMKVFISAPWYSEIKLSGSGNIYCDSLDNHSISFVISGSGDIDALSYADNTDVLISGSGNVELKGFSETADYRISGSGKIRAYEYETNNCFCNISGSGNMYVFANNLLDVKISGSGNVHYIGNPQVVVSVTGSGNVIHE